MTGAEDDLASELKAVEAELMREANLKADRRYEGALLAKYVGMKPCDQAAMFGELITVSDGPSLAALLDAPAVLKAVHCAKVPPSRWRCAMPSMPLNSICAMLPLPC